MLPRRARVLAAVVLAALFASRAAAQDTPEAAARAYFDALRGQRWGEAAALVDSAAVLRFRRQRIEFARMERNPPRLTEEFLRRMDPKMPECVARYQVEQSRRGEAEALERMRELLPGVSTPEEVEALPPRELVARYLRSEDPRVQEEVAVRMGLAARPELKDSLARAGFRIPRDSFPSVRRTVVGSVREGDTLAYVLFRSGLGMGEGREITRMQVLPMVRRGAVWRIASVDREGDTDFTFGFDLEPEEKAGVRG